MMFQNINLMVGAVKNKRGNYVVCITCFNVVMFGFSCKSFGIGKQDKNVSIHKQFKNVGFY